MLRTLSVTALLCAMAIPASRLWADAPAKAAEPAKPIWDQPAELKLEPDPLKLAEQRAADPGAPDYSDNWRFRTFTTIWAASLTGTAGKGDFETDIDIGFDDIIDKATVSLSLNFEVGKGPWTFIFFGLWLHLEDDHTTKRGFDADIDGNFVVIDGAGSYHFMDFSLGEGTVYLEALLGARWTYLNFNVEINEGPLAGARSERDKDWIDPYIGLRARWYINHDWTVTGMGTIGGFGVGSDLAASGDLQAEWRFSDRWSAILGYRAFYYDYDDNFEWQVTMHGPYIGISTRW